MNPSPGAHQPEPLEPPGLQAAVGGFTAAGVRFLQALTGLFGLELRETGGQALLLGSLAVASCIAFLIPFPELATSFPLAFIPIPLLVLGAMRLGPRGSSLMSTAIAA